VNYYLLKAQCAFFLNPVPSRKWNLGFDNVVISSFGI
jgi:hypothetical protein